MDTPRPAPLLNALRTRHYNATLISTLLLTPDLARFRILPDRPPNPWRAGQFALLGLGDWEPRAPHTQPEPPAPAQPPHLIRRAYSISAQILGPHDELIDPTSEPELEFYISLVRSSPSGPPALTPRLFHLQPGDRLHLGDRITGHHTLESVRPDQSVLFLSTGTGEAPHNAMLAELLLRGHRGPILAAVSVRQRAELGYLAVHRRLEARFPRYRYLPLTTREPENLDPSVPGYVGKQYLQELLTGGAIDRALGGQLDPSQTQAFLCGNPQMIGVPHAGPAGDRVYPRPTGLVELLEQRGLRCPDRNSGGNIHFEKYW